MIHEGVVQVLLEDKRFNTTEPSLRPTVVRALRLAKRINRLYGNKVPIVHILDNGIKAGYTLQQILERKMNERSDRESSVTVGTPPWWGDYILVGTARLMSYYPADAFTKRDHAGRLVPTEETPKGKTPWDEGTAKGSETDWKQLVVPKDDMEGQRLAKRYGLEPITHEDLPKVHKASGKDAQGRIQPSSSPKHLHAEAMRVLGKMEAQAEADLMGEEDEDEIAEIRQYLTDLADTKRSVTNAMRSGLLTYQGLLSILAKHDIEPGPRGDI